MSGYTKLFSVILASTIWEADMPTRIVWITLLAMKDKTGKVEASIPGLATLARVPVAQVRQAIENLKAPDPDSRSKIEEGRRIRDVDGGWYVINHEKYRNMLNADERREYLRVKQAEFREKKHKSTKVNNVNNVSDKYTESTHTDPYTDADTKKIKSVSSALKTPTPEPPAILVFPVTGTTQIWNLTQQHLDQWTDAYPHLDVLAESRKALAWIHANRRKTASGMPRFLVSWLNRATNSDTVTRAPIPQRSFATSASPADRPHPDDDPEDWFQICKRIHNGECELDRYKHYQRLRTDAVKAGAAS